MQIVIALASVERTWKEVKLRGMQMLEIIINLFVNMHMLGVEKNAECSADDIFDLS